MQLAAHLTLVRQAISVKIDPRSLTRNGRGVSVGEFAEEFAGELRVRVLCLRHRA